MKAAVFKAEEKKANVVAAITEAERERSAATAAESNRSWWYTHRTERISGEIKSLAHTPH